MQKLRMVFLNAAGKKVTFNQKNCHQELTGEVVKGFMDGVAALKLISKDGILQYESPQSADYVETIVTELF